MLEFLTHYPIEHYIKSLTQSKSPDKLAYYFSREQSKMMIKTKTDIIYWNKNLKTIQGAPNIENTLQKQPSSQIPSSFRKNIVKEYKLNKNDEVSIVIDDPETYTTPYTITEYETAGQLEAALLKDPGSVIISWKNYNVNTDYVWEILSTGMHILRDGAKLPKKVILCGFPEKRAFDTAQWCLDQDQELINIIPLIPAVIQWAMKHGPLTGFYLLIQSPYEIAICYIENKELKIFTTHKTKEGFTPDEIGDINEIVEELNHPKDIPIWTWGIEEGSIALIRLTSKYPKIRTLNTKELKGITTLESKGENIIDEKEAWILDNITL